VEVLASSAGAADGTAAQSTVPLAHGVSHAFLVHHRICPCGLLDDGTVAVAVVPDSLLSGLDDLSVAYGRPVVARPHSVEALQILIARTAAGGDRPGPARQEPVEGALVSDIRDLANQPPVVRYVNLLLREGYEANASDVHLESTLGGLRARFRIDGVLVPALAPPPLLDAAVISRVKLLADLDIAERRRPQDGRIRMRLEERDIDIRVSTVPSTLGESVVLRLLDQGPRAVVLADLGLPAALLREVDRLARRPHGMILVTGPTGSGKTTTLYAALRLRDAAREKIITVEDPVEYAVDGITQVAVQRQAGVTFASVLRSILRQDPDVLMVGEMRDAETAELAVQAALTGHVVFSTLHTNDAVGAIPRLIDLGVPPYLVAATLDAVLSQRLVRRTCDRCREPYTPDVIPPIASAASVVFTRGAGCAHCRHTGYQGRVGLFELLLLTPEMRNAIAGGVAAGRLAELGGAGRMTMLQDGWAKAAAGITTIEEVLRVTQSDA
jgi:type II secretory ATPase GspE/PulE/Tfp pilus assembly ATPase PilB-like protein